MLLAPAVVATAHHEPIHLPRIVKLRAGLDTVDKVIILLSGPYRDRRRAEDESHLAVRDTVDIIVEPAPRVARNREVAHRHNADNNEYKDSGYNENLFPHKQSSKTFLSYLYIILYNIFLKTTCGFVGNCHFDTGTEERGKR